MAERMLEAIRKDYWRADEQTRRELVATWTGIATRHDVHTSNETFKAYVKALAAGYGLGAQPAPAGQWPRSAPGRAAAGPRRRRRRRLPRPPQACPDVVRGQQLREVPMTAPDAAADLDLWLADRRSCWPPASAWQAWRTRRENRCAPFNPHPEPRHERPRKPSSTKSPSSS
jgi:cobaltochelatase CobN